MVKKYSVLPFRKQTAIVPSRLGSLRPSHPHRLQLPARAVRPIPSIQHHLNLHHRLGLHLIQVMINPAQCHQLGVAALLGYAAAMQDDNLLGVADGGEVQTCLCGRGIIDKFTRSQYAQRRAALIMACIPRDKCLGIVRCLGEFQNETVQRASKN